MEKANKKHISKLKRKEERKRRKKIGIEKKKKRALWKNKKLNRLDMFKRKSNKSKIEYQFYSKSRSFEANFSSVTFRHVNFKGAILTSCSFKNASFIGVEFWGTNLRKSNFSGAKFQYCIFVGTLLDKANFRNAKFENCIFVNTSFKNIKNFSDIPSGIKVLSEYPQIKLSQELIDVLNELRENSHILRCKILHLNNSKLNNLNIMLLLERFTEERLIKGLRYAKENIKIDMPTISCLFVYLLKNKEKIC